MSTRASLNNEMISKLKITIPSLQNQMKISHILLALLKKKNQSKKIIANLEELFKHYSNVGLLILNFLMKMEIHTNQAVERWLIVNWVK